jgi:hypothetical protein
MFSLPQFGHFSGFRETFASHPHLGHEASITPPTLLTFRRSITYRCRALFGGLYPGMPRTPKLYSSCSAPYVRGPAHEVMGNEGVAANLSLQAGATQLRHEFRVERTEIVEHRRDRRDRVAQVLFDLHHHLKRRGGNAGAGQRIIEGHNANLTAA